MTQRWLFRRDQYRPAGEPIETRRYEVAPIVVDAPAKAFVRAHHYSGTYPAARFRFGLYRGAELQGVAVFSVPASPRVLSAAFPDPTAAVELGRFVLLDQVPGNGETWFLGRAFELLRAAGIEGVLSFSDPLPRRTVDGRLLTPGHVGTIYQAHNGVYLGRGTARTLRLLPDGTTFSDRAASKLRARDRGWRYAAAQLEAAGAAPLGDQDPAAWLRLWLPRVTRTVAHPGNHRYAWGIAPAMRRALGRPLAALYPKTREAA